MKVTTKRIQDLIKGLKRTQAEEVFCQMDIAEAVLGEDAEKACVHKVSIGEKKTKERSLVRAFKAQGKVTNGNIGCFDREEYLELLEERLNQVDGDVESLSSPQENDGEERV